MEIIVIITIIFASLILIQQSTMKRLSILTKVFVSAIPHLDSLLQVSLL